MAGKLPQILNDAPVTRLMDWEGYSAKRDKTMLPPTWLVDPSQNCVIPDGDKVLPRFGSQIRFQGSAPVVSFGTIGGYIKYKNFAGIEMDVKANRQTTAGEQVLVLFNGVYVPITKSPNTTLNGTGKIYFSTYSDTNLDLSLNKRIPRLCWTNGYEDPSTGTGRVFSWTGGIAAINTILANVITLPVGQTWRKLGFSENFPQTTRVYVTINGVEYFSTSVAELDTNTLTLNASPVAVAGDIVTSAVEVDNLVAPMEMLKQNKNYMYYGNPKLRQWYMSNQFGRPFVTRVTQSNAVQDDLTIGSNNNYTGTGRNIYKILIDSIDPATNTQRYVGTGTPASFNTSGYSGSGSNFYEMRCVYTQIITGNAGSLVGTFQNGEMIIGGTSGAVGIIYQNDPININLQAGLRTISGQFLPGETVTGQASGATITVVSLQESTGASFWKDGAQITSMVTGFGPDQNGFYQLSLNSTPSTASLTFIDGLLVTFPTAFSMDYGDVLSLDINAGSPDEYRWQKNNGTLSAAANVSTSNTAIVDGITVRWSKTTGHVVGDFWIIEANQRVERPWANFYYTLDFTTQNPIRRPGEGYVYELPSNFWTMDTFEDSMYLNGSNGEWGYSSPTLSADLLSEDISFVPLKQVAQSKVLYPYLTGHNRNDLIFIDENRNLTSLGRLVLMEKVQNKNMSDVVLNKFQELSFEDGSIVFQDNTTWITSPRDGIMMAFNERRQYWQPPQVVPNLGILTVIGTKLYVHAYLNSATRELNDPTAVGDDGVEYEVIVRNPTYDHGDRWRKKTTNQGFWEGYLENGKTPPMKMRAYFDPDGCAGIKEVDILPIFCTDVVNNGNFGGGQDGGHEFGGDETIASNYARFQWKSLKVHHFYFSSLEFRCRSDEHPYELLSMGINLAESKFNNKDYDTPEGPIDSLLPL